MQLLIYLGAGVTTGWQVFSLLLWAVWGRPVSVMEFVALAGAFGLIAAALCTSFNGRAATGLALPATVLLWIFYLPALVATVFYSPGTRVWDWTVFVPPLLLSAATIQAMAEGVVLVKTQGTLK